MGVSETKERLKERLFDNELAAYATQGFNILEPFVDDHVGEIKAIEMILAAGKSNLRKDELWRAIVDANDEITQDEANRFYDLYRILRGDRFNLASDGNEFIFFEKTPQSVRRIPTWLFLIGGLTSLFLGLSLLESSGSILWFSLSVSIGLTLLVYPVARLLLGGRDSFLGVTLSVIFQEAAKEWMTKKLQESEHEKKNR